MKRRRPLALLLCLAAALVMLLPAGPAAATTQTASGQIDPIALPVHGQAAALTLSITHPVVAEWTIDVNLATPFVAPALQITNHTLCPVAVAIHSLARGTGGTLPFTDVMPDHFSNWQALDRADSAAYLALGIQATASPEPLGDGWAAGHATDVRWAAASGDFCCGHLPADATGFLTLHARHGLAFDTNYTAHHQLVFLFTLV